MIIKTAYEADDGDVGVDGQPHLLLQCCLALRLTLVKGFQGVVGVAVGRQVGVFSGVPRGGVHAVDDARELGGLLLQHLVETPPAFLMGREDARGEYAGHVLGILWAEYGGHIVWDRKVDALLRGDYMGDISMVGVWG